MDSARTTVPSQVKRQLRQESGFGCCICGHAFIEFHHIVPFAEEQHFRHEDMMALCPNHHHLVTVGAISSADQRAHKARPKNIIDNKMRGHLHVNSQKLVIKIAGGEAINTPNLLTLGNETVLRARLSDELGRVLLSARIHNREGAVIAELVDNEWAMAPQDVWDFEAYPRHAKIRNAPKDISFSVDVRDDDAVALEGKWFHRGQEIGFTQREAKIGTNRFIGNTVVDCGGMIRVG
jgi:hypothetical protein